MITIDTEDPKDVWFNAVASRLPGADPSNIVEELTDCINEFLQKTNFIQTLQARELVEGQSRYELNPIDYTAVSGALGFTGVQGLYIHHIVLPNGRAVIPRNRLPFRDPVTGNSVLAVWCPEPAVAELLPTPTDVNAGETFYIASSLVLTRPVKETPTLVSQYYYDVILDGVTGRMMGHAKRPYSNPVLGAYHLQRYRDGIRQARDEAIRRWGNAEAGFTYGQSWARNRPLRVSR